jgi:hypothetical protein
MIYFSATIRSVHFVHIYQKGSEQGTFKGTRRRKWQSIWS